MYQRMTKDAGGEMTAETGVRAKQHLAQMGCWGVHHAESRGRANAKFRGENELGLLSLEKKDGG